MKINQILMIIIIIMDLTYDSWWLEEVKEHYRLFKFSASIIFSMFSLLSISGIIINSSNNVEGIPTKYLISFIITLASLLALMWYMHTHFNNICLGIAFISIECVNIGFSYISNKTLKDHTPLLCIGSTVVTLLFQIGFVKSLKFSFLITLKHLFIWYTSRLLFGDISAHFPISYMGHIAITVHIMINEYIKRKKSYEKYHIIKKLELTQRNLKTILDSFPDGLIVLNNDLSIVYSNKKILEFMNCKSECLENILKNIKYIENRRYYFSNTDNDMLINDIEHSKDFEIGKECSLGLSSKFNQMYNWKLKKVLWEDSESILLTCVNITKTIQLEKTHAENNSKVSIIKSFSHELRTPISAVMHYIDLSLESKCLSKEVHKYLKYASISSKQLFSQINDIIDLSNILCDKFKIMKQTFNLRQWVTENLEIFQVLAEEKNIKFSIIIDELLPVEIHTDPYRLKQVAYCFINNSLKFTFNGVIKILLTLTADNLLKFQFIDSGIGITKERAQHLLDFLSGNTTAYDSGIGLYISKLILEHIGKDKIILQSALGKGTEFSFNVDIQTKYSIKTLYEINDMTLEENLNLCPIRLFETTNLHQENSEILIVDDIELNRKILISILKDLRPNYLEAENGQEAVEIIKRMNSKNNHVKVVIMDCNMPVMDGLEATRRIKAMEASKTIYKSPKIIAYTTNSSEDDITMCYKCGMSYCLIKPSTPSEIIETVKYYLKNH